MITLKTSLGDIVLELNPEKAPETVKNFENYIDEGFYEGTLFHRVISGFMIQGGGMDENFQQKKTHNPIPNEADNGLKNEPYSIAMARTSDPHSATSQFFINVADNNFLNFRSADPQNYGYCVFGRVVKGQDVVDKIAQVKTMSRGFHQDVPKENVVITKIERSED